MDTTNLRIKGREKATKGIKKERRNKKDIGSNKSQPNKIERKNVKKLFDSFQSTFPNI